MECKMKSLIGISGIMIQETCQIFTIISSDNKMRCKFSL